MLTIAILSTGEGAVIGAIKINDPNIRIMFIIHDMPARSNIFLSLTPFS